MDRRQFLRDVFLWSVGMSLTIPRLTILPEVLAAQRPQSLLGLAKGEDYMALVGRVLTSLGGMGNFVRPGDRVVVKPNIGWDSTPELAANTNPVVVATLVRMALEAGAKKVKVFDRTCNDPRRCYVQSGIEAAAKAAGAEVSFVDERKFRDVKIPGGVAIQSWPLYIELLEADKIINAPIAKHHGLAKLTLSHKNWMGMMGGDRGKIHQQIDQALVDLSLVIKPCLVLLDAVRILTDHGPKGGNPADVKKLDTVIAGVNQVSIDAYGATLFGRTGADLGYVVNGAKRGLGVMDLSRLAIRRLEA